MKITLVKKEELITQRWAGGTTTELSIYPAGTTFAQRNFDFRISYATVEVEESTFTFFEGVHRHLMILKGELHLTHHDRYEKILKPFDQDSFSGEWKTSARGKVTDFNLMVTGVTSGNLEALFANAGEEIKIPLGKKESFIGIYPFKGAGTVHTSNRMLDMTEGDFCLITRENDLNECSFFPEKESILIISRVELHQKKQ